MSKRTDPMRNLQVQNAAARLDAADADKPADVGAGKRGLPVDNEALTIAIRATLDQRKSKKRTAATTPPPEPDQALDQLMATYGRSKPRRSKTQTEE